MREVIPGVLWIGNAHDARDVRGVLARGINVVIDLAFEEPPIQFPYDIVNCRFPLLDGEGNPPELLQSAIDTAANFVKANQPTLVACSGGMSRSPIIVSAVLGKIKSLELNAAVERVTATGPCDFSPSLWNDVQELFNQRKPSSTSRLNLIVLRSMEPSRTLSFYTMLAMTFQQEQHGSGPVHWAADLDGIVLEIYPANSADEVDATTRIGFNVNDAVSVLDKLRSSNAEIVGELKKTKWGLRAVVRDSDGRSVELTQCDR
jgi:predicted enzyme related to lactoylglutathione lyase